MTKKGKTDMKSKFIETIQYLNQSMDEHETLLKMYNHELRQERAWIIFYQMTHKCDCSECPWMNCPNRLRFN